MTCVLQLLSVILVLITDQQADSTCTIALLIGSVVGALVGGLLIGFITAAVAFKILFGVPSCRRGKTNMWVHRFHICVHKWHLRLIYNELCSVCIMTKRPI